ncbi:MAG: NERD domain-containing protein [Promethearchaeota archaeon]
MEFWSEDLLKQFYTEIYHNLVETEENIVEIWYDTSEFPLLSQFNIPKLKDFLGNINSISLQKGNYQYYIVINKIIFIMEAINILQLDIRQITRILDYNGFEALIQEILSKNNYISIKNFRFSDRSNFKSETSQKKYEIDIIGIYNKHILLVDAKQWKRKDSFSALNKAANLQLRRVIALKKNPEVFTMLIQEVLGIKLNLKKRLPFILIPIIVTLEDNSIKINNNQVPLVSIYEFNSFLYELQNNLQYFRTIKINKVNIQQRLL